MTFDRNRAIIETYATTRISLRNLGKVYGISGERVRTLLPPEARMAHENLMNGQSNTEFSFKIPDKYSSEISLEEVFNILLIKIRKEK